MCHKWRTSSMYSPLSLHHAHMSIRSTPVCSFVRWFCGSCNLHLRLHDVQYKLGHAANRQHYNQRLFLAENSANIRHRILTVRTTFALLQPAGRIRLMNNIRQSYSTIVDSNSPATVFSTLCWRSHIVWAFAGRQADYHWWISCWCCKLASRYTCQCQRLQTSNRVTKSTL